MVPSFVWDFIVGLGAIGFYTVVFYCLATWLYRNKLLKPLDVQSIYGNGDWWAVVTGSTDGAGKGWAIKMAQEGLNVVLVSRNPEKLDKVRSEILNDYDVQVKCVAIDFSGDAFSDYMPKLKEAVHGVKVAALINNVGMVYTDKIADTDPAKVNAIVNTNINSLNFVSLSILPQMIRRRRGFVINVASDSALASTAEWGYYAGSKAYMTLYTEAMQRELEPVGIHVLLSRPGFIKTRLVAEMKTVAALTVEEYCSGTLADVGRKKVSSGDARNAFMQFLLSFDFTKELMLKYFYSYYDQ